VDRRDDGSIGPASGSLSDGGIGDGDADVGQRAFDCLGVDAGGSIRGLVGRVRDGATTPTFRVGIAILGVILVALVLAVLFIRASVRPITTPRAPETESAPVATTTTTGPGVVVDVGGAVRAPGVYRLALGARVVDALEAAGGPADDIDLDRVNLAAPILDGQRVWLTRRGDVAEGATQSAAVGVPVTTPVDLNAATLDQLDGLPGIGPTTARAILERRREVGRFRSVDDLLTVKGIGEAKLDALRASVVVR